MGTAVNALVVIIGGIIGTFLKNKLSEKLVDQISAVLGISVLLMGIVKIIPSMVVITSSGQIQVHHTLLLIISMTFGYAIGYFLKLESLFNKVGEKIEKKLNKEGFSKGFVSASVLFCVGAMTITGSILDGLGQPETLYIKSVLDFISAIILSSTIGYGVIFSSITVLVYQGSIALLANVLNNLIPVELFNMITMIGYAIVIIIGLNFAKITKIETANLLPAILVPFAYYFLTLLI